MHCLVFLGPALLNFSTLTSGVVYFIFLDSRCLISEKKLIKIKFLLPLVIFDLFYCKYILMQLYAIVMKFSSRLKNKEKFELTSNKSNNFLLIKLKKMNSGLLGAK